MHQIRLFSESVPVFDSEPSRPEEPKSGTEWNRLNRNLNRTRLEEPKNRTGLESEPWKPEPNRIGSGFHIARRVSLLFHSVLFRRFRFPRFRFQTGSIFWFFESRSVQISVQTVPFGSAFRFFGSIRFLDSKPARTGIGASLALDLFISTMLAPIRRLEEQLSTVESYRSWEVQAHTSTRSPYPFHGT